jgi:hypothetical protein
MWLGLCRRPFADIRTPRSIRHYSLCPVIGSALVHDQFKKTNGKKPFVQYSNVDLFRDTQRVFKFDT